MHGYLPMINCLITLSVYNMLGTYIKWHLHLNYTTDNVSLNIRSFVSVQYINITTYNNI